jgi:hypothetical protein
VYVRRIYRECEMTPVDNLIREGLHNFAADGVIAHSFTTLRAARAALNKIGILPVQTSVIGFYFAKNQTS